MKICAKCGVKKTDDLFYRASSGGPMNQCKDCTRKARKLRYWINPEKSRAATREYSKKYPDKRRSSYRNYLSTHKKEYLEYQRCWRERHKEQQLEYGRKYRLENKEKLSQRAKENYITIRDGVIARVKQYKQTHPITRKSSKHRRRVMERTAIGHFNDEEWRKLTSDCGNVCACCKQEKTLTVDHIVPLSKGGTNKIENIQPLCLSCNSRKHDKTINYMRAE